MSRLLPFVLAALCASCVSNGLGYRDHEEDPDVLLAELLDEYEHPSNDRIVLDRDRARNRLAALSFEFPAHVPTLLANALVAFEERDDVAAQRYLDRLFAIQPIHPEAAVLRSRLGLRQGNLPAAKRMLENHLRHAPDHAGLHEALAEVLFLEGDFDAALARCDIAEDLGAPDWRMAFNRGLIAETEGELMDAAKHYAEALKCNPDMAQAESRMHGVQAVLNHQSR